MARQAGQWRGRSENTWPKSPGFIESVAESAAWVVGGFTERPTRRHGFMQPAPSLLELVHLPQGRTDAAPPSPSMACDQHQGSIRSIRLSMLVTWPVARAKRLKGGLRAAVT